MDSMNGNLDSSATRVTLALTPIQRELMREQVERHAPFEACGLLGGQISGELYEVHVVIPTRNQLASRAHFQVDPKEQIDAFMLFEKQGIELVAIYHSHPSGPQHPSPTDIAQAYYPSAVQLIWFEENGSWECRGYMIREGTFTEAEIKSKP